MHTPHIVRHKTVGKGEPPLCTRSADMKQTAPESSAPHTPGAVAGNRHYRFRKLSASPGGNNAACPGIPVEAQQAAAVGSSPHAAIAVAGYAVYVWIRRKVELESAVVVDRDAVFPRPHPDAPRAVLHQHSYYIAAQRPVVVGIAHHALHVPVLFKHDDTVMVVAYPHAPVPVLQHGHHIALRERRASEAIVPCVRGVAVQP